jgi:hypothetical protein
MTMPDEVPTPSRVHKLSTVVETFELARRFGSVTAVADISMTVNSSEIFELIGPNGAGKSTLIKMLTTLLPPSSGRVRVTGFDVVTQPGEVRQRIGYVPQLLSADGADCRKQPTAFLRCRRRVEAHAVTGSCKGLLPLVSFVRGCDDAAGRRGVAQFHLNLRCHSHPPKFADEMKNFD